MPRVHVVDKSIALDELTRSLVRPRAKVSEREAAIAAILTANPGLTLGEPVAAGTVIIVPSVVPEVTVRDDPAENATDDLLARVRQGIDDLAAAADAGDGQREAAKKETQRLMSSSAVRRLASEQPRLAAAVDESRSDLRDAATEGRQQATRFAADKQRWNAELDDLRKLFGSG